MRIAGRASVVAVTAVFLVTGCGESQEATEERIAREREEAAEQARTKERLRVLERERARDGRRESTEDSKGGSPAPTPSSTRTACGDGIAVGPNTSCSFGRNVRDTYRESGGSGTIEVYSPVTGQTYTMSCTAGVTTVCTGGNNATVYLR